MDDARLVTNILAELRYYYYIHLSSSTQDTRAKKKNMREFQFRFFLHRGSGARLALSPSIFARCCAPASALKHPHTQYIITTRTTQWQGGA